MLLSRTVRLFLDSIGKREEYEYYLNRFQRHEAPFFALIVPDRETMELSGDLLVFDLQFLVSLGLKAAILLHEENAEACDRCLAAYPETFVDSETPVEGRIAVLRRVALAVPEAVVDVIGSRSRRLHWIRCSGGLHAAETDLAVPLHYTRRANRHTLSAPDQAVADATAKIFDVRPDAHVSVCSPLAVLEELFTVKGHGTMMRRGSEILRFSSADLVDRARLRGLFEDAFGRALRPQADFSAVSEWIIEADYNGAALFEQHSAGRFLSKFAVARAVRGGGLSQELWEEASADGGPLFWRSRRTNPFNPWYEKQAEGVQRVGDWHIYWRGIAPAHIPSLIDYCLSRPVDFVE